MGESMGNFEESNYEKNLLDRNGVIELLEKATINKTSLSLARFGHGEVYIAWNTYPDWILGWKFREYTGSTGSPKELQKELQHALKICDIAGLHVSSSKSEEDRNCANATRIMLKELNITPPYVCSAWIAHGLIYNNRFCDWLRQQKVFLVGRRAKEAEVVFKKRGHNIVGTLTLEGYDQIQSVCDALCEKKEWNVALISAGIPATIITPKLAKASNRVVIDFGHAMDMAIEGNKFNHDKKLQQFNEQKEKDGK